jgi:hypothetical protein
MHRLRFESRLFSLGRAYIDSMYILHTGSSSVPVGEWKREWSRGYRRMKVRGVCVLALPPPSLALSVLLLKLVYLPSRSQEDVYS